MGFAFASGIIYTCYNCKLSIVHLLRSWIGSLDGVRYSGQPDNHSDRFPLDLCRIRLLLIERYIQRSEEMALFGRNSDVVPLTPANALNHQSVHWIQTLVSGMTSDSNKKYTHFVTNGLIISN